MLNFLWRLVSEIISCDFFDCSDWPTTGHEHLPYERWLCAHWTTSLSGAHHVTMISSWARSLSQLVDIEVWPGNIGIQPGRHPNITLLHQYQTSVSISDKWSSEKEREREREREWASGERERERGERVCVVGGRGERERKGRDRERERYIHICSVLFTLWSTIWFTMADINL